jgi:hypothetical protein
MTGEIEDMTEHEDSKTEKLKADKDDYMKAEESKADGNAAENGVAAAEAEADRDGNVKDAAAELKAAWQKVSVEDVMSFVSDGLGLYFAVLLGMRLHSFWCGVGTYVFMVIKKLMIGCWVGDGEHKGKIGFEEMCVDEKLAERCMKHSAWLDGLVTLGLIVGLKLGWLEILFAK